MPFRNPIFIVGLPRTGSTLWANTITGDKDILRFSEMHFLNPWHRDFTYFLKKYVGGLESDRGVKRMLDLLFTGEKYKGLRQEFWMQLTEVRPDELKERLSSRILNSDRSLESVFKALVEEATTIRGFDRCLIKFPVYVDKIHLLRKWYPESKIVHITRDPRATALSKTNDPGGTAKMTGKHPWAKPFIRTAMKYFVCVQYIWSSYAHVKNKGRDNYSLFQFERLLRDPEKTVRELCSFLEIDFDEAMTTPKSGQASSVTGQKSSGFNLEAAFRWEQKLSSFDRKLIRLLTRNSMRRLEYFPEEFKTAGGAA